MVEHPQSGDSPYGPITNGQATRVAPNDRTGCVRELCRRLVDPNPNYRRGQCLSEPAASATNVQDRFQPLSYQACCDRLVNIARCARIDVRPAGLSPRKPGVHTLTIRFR